ncbi:MAG: Rrf2 family transcriptional regulator [Firmicutes bacterium]|nr:Rrf2 family transcriptional regulator [Bacillota bacterium]
MITTRGRYALRMMVDLAEHQESGFVSLKEIAKRQDISRKYLEQIIPMLNRASLLQTSRGSGGGYKLIKAPKDYTVGEILRAAEGSMAPVSCLEGEINTCPRCIECATLFVWQGLKELEEDYLNGITLQDIIDKQAQNAGNDYNI